MKTLRAAVLISSLLALAGCSTSGNKVDYQSDAEKAAALEIPPDLTVPATDDHYSIPDGSKETVASYSDYAKGGAPQNPACTCKEASAAVPVAATATGVTLKLQDQSDGSKRILINEPFDRCWLTVGEALGRAGLATEDMDYSKGLLFLKGGHNQLVVRAGAAGCEVTANNGSGATNDETKRIIDQLYKALGK